MWGQKASPVMVPNVHVRGAVANVTVGNDDALECSVSFLALKPPIFEVITYIAICQSPILHVVDFIKNYNFSIYHVNIKVV